MSNAKVMENRLRRTADRLGYFVSKSRLTGLWSIRDDEARFFTGPQLDLHDVTVDEVAEHLEAALTVEDEQRVEREKAEATFFEEEARTRFPRLFGGADGEDVEGGEDDKAWKPPEPPPPLQGPVPLRN